MPRQINPFPKSPPPNLSTPKPPMPAAFLALPRELRDLIYDEVLISPTGYVTPSPIPISSKASKISFRRSRFTILMTTLTHDNVRPTESPNGNVMVTISINRVCRQVYNETRHVFWRKNIFYFQTPLALTTTVKDMGQISSRLIQRITLSFSISDAKIKSLAKAFRLLASRSRYGAFQTLELNIARKEFIAIQACRMSSQTEKVGLYDELLEALREGGREGRFKKELKVEPLLKEWRAGGTSSLDWGTARELHCAWGGRMFVGGELEWVDYMHCGRSYGASEKSTAGASGVQPPGQIAQLAY
ncbi:hypothetical protein B0O99DRAFT_588847 [Bisporella sp. PMI_857]|nr:hypothetical protein B0O99DRAFT_588847 [Bisporella sp. PMI_857]